MKTCSGCAHKLPQTQQYFISSYAQIVATGELVSQNLDWRVHMLLSVHLTPSNKVFLCWAAREYSDSCCHQKDESNRGDDLVEAIDLCQIASNLRDEPGLL